MQVRFVESGGMAGQLRGCDLHTDRLPPDDARQLRQLVADGGLTRSVTSYSKAARDLREYEIEIDDGGEKITAVFDDSTLPATARPLVGFLRTHARPMPP